MTGPAPDPRGPLDPDGRPIPEQATLGLLNYLTAHSLDEDYAHVSARRRESGVDRADGRTHAAVRRPGARWPTVLALALFGVLVATAGLQTSRNAPASESSRASLVAQVQDRRAELAETRDQLAALRTEVTGTQTEVLEASTTGRQLAEELDRLGLSTGADPATGPGVRIVVDDSGSGLDEERVLDTDLQILVNGLWTSGAEAVAVNGQRLTALSAIRVAGEAITVNSRSLTQPFVVTALGDPDELAARFLDSEGGAWWLNLKAVYDLQFTMTTEDSLTVPAAPPVALRHASRPRDDR